MIKLKSEGHQRIIWPLYSLALTSLALGIFMQKPYSRRGNGAILLKAGLAVVVVIGLHFAARNASSKLEIMNVLCYVNIAICFGMSYLLFSEESRLGRRIGKLFS
jgi:lipopolysaccharide export LptBFGC system permease protein LptF